jgi:O-antigen/teichoic acid export membrane protein
LQIVRVVYVLVLARYLGPELYGWFSYGQSWYLALLPLTGLGLAEILGREVGRHRHQAGPTVAQSLTLLTVVAIAVALGSGLVGWCVEERAEVRWLILIFSVALAGHAVSNWTGTVFIAYEETQYCLRQGILFRPLDMVLGLGALLTGFGVMAVACIYAASWWIQSFQGLALIRRYIVPVHYTWRWRPLLHLLAQGLPIAVGIFCVTWLQQGPLVLFRLAAGEAYSLGELALAMKVFTPLCAVASIIPLAALPALSRTVGRGDGLERVFTENMLQMGLLLGAVAGFLGLAFGPLVVETLLGSPYKPAGELLGLALWLLVPWSWGHTVWRVLLARDQTLASTVCAMGGALVLSLTLPFFVSRFGVSGALLAAGAGIGVWSMSLLALLSQADGLDVVHGICRPGAVALVALGLFVLLKPWQVWLAFPIAILTLLGGSLGWDLLTADERSLTATLKRALFTTNHRMRA